ncbi:MAG: DNA starvation/stationary phase protection protein [Simkaniaceae bacterium]|nr:MAG: DNA starvation/stationary phase protection protein [Simkaniaceae bacterium]
MECDALNVNIDLPNREKICEILHKLLASSYTLYLKTQNYHWNVTGPHFHALHLLFQSQYEELAISVDEIAERIRALGFFPSGSFEAFKKLTLISEETRFPEATEMLQKLLADHESLIQFLRKNFPIIEGEGDSATADFINKRLEVHEKTSWMLRSTLS